VTTTERADEVLEEKECLRLLGAAGIGRVAYTEGALPRIRPVSYAMRDHVVVIPTRAEDPLAHAVRGAVIALGVDDYDGKPGSRWNVTVVGRAHVGPAGDPPGTTEGPAADTWLIMVQATLIIGGRTSLPAWRAGPGDLQPARS